MVGWARNPDRHQLLEPTLNCSTSPNRSTSATDQVSVAMVTSRSLHASPVGGGAAPG